MHCQLINRLSTFDALEQKAYWLANNRSILMNINILISIKNILTTMNTIDRKESHFLKNSYLFQDIKEVNSFFLKLRTLKL